MALYSFFLCRHDGDATAFEVHDLPGDAGASEFARRVQAEHPSAAYIEVFSGGREIPHPARTARAA